MMSSTGASAWRVILGSILSIVYTIAIMVNLLACLWYWVGAQSPTDVGWLAQEYSARHSCIFYRFLCSA